MGKSPLRLPYKPFMYTMDQVSSLLEVQQARLDQICHYQGRDVGVVPKDKILAVNIMPEGETPEWRIPERSLILWMRRKGIRYSTRGYI